MNFLRDFTGKRKRGGRASIFNCKKVQMNLAKCVYCIQCDGWAFVCVYVWWALVPLRVCNYLFVLWFVCLLAFQFFLSFFLSFLLLISIEILLCCGCSLLILFDMIAIVTAYRPVQRIYAVYYWVDDLPQRNCINGSCRSSKWTRNNIIRISVEYIYILYIWTNDNYKNVLNDWTLNKRAQQHYSLARSLCFGWTACEQMLGMCVRVLICFTT